MKKYYLVIFTILISIQFSCQSQNKTESTPSKYNYYELDSKHKDIYTNDIIELYSGSYFIDEPFLYSKLVTGNQDSLYVLNANPCFSGEVNTNDSLPLFIFTKNGKIIKKFTYPDILDKRMSHILNIALSDKYFFVNYVGMINVYDRNNLEFVKSINLKSRVNWLKIVNNSLYALDNRMGTGSENSSAICYEINLDKLTIANEWEFDMPRGANMTFISKNIFGVWEKGFYLSDITYYNIKFYDFNKKLLYEINYEPDNWLKNEELAKKIDSYKQTPNDFDNFRKDLKKLEAISTIEGIYFLNDSTFILKKDNYNKQTKSKFDNLLIDIWRLSNNKWKLLYADVKIKNDKTNKINGLYSNLFGLNTLGRNYFYSYRVNVVLDYAKDEIINTGTYEDLYNKEEEAIINGIPPRTSFIIYKYIGD